jgi:hypothetical protein
LADNADILLLRAGFRANQTHSQVWHYSEGRAVHALLRSSDYGQRAKKPHVRDCQFYKLRNVHPGSRANHQTRVELSRSSDAFCPAAVPHDKEDIWRVHNPYAFAAIQDLLRTFPFALRYILPDRATFFRCCFGVCIPCNDSSDRLYDPTVCGILWLASIGHIVNKSYSFRLIFVASRDLPFVVEPLSLRQGIVVKSPVRFKENQKFPFLVGVGPEAEFVSAKHPFCAAMYLRTVLSLDTREFLITLEWRKAKEETPSLPLPAKLRKHPDVSTLGASKTHRTPHSRSSAIPVEGPGPIPVSHFFVQAG